MKSNRLSRLACLCAATLLFSACGVGEPDPTQDTQTAPSTTEQPTTAPPPRPNPLTGLPMAEDYRLQRPVAIMINNLKEATPPKGLSKFDAAFEVLAEGSINRIIAVFYDYTKLGDVGSVRSARDYYFKLVLPLDPIICHYGASPAAFQYIRNNGLDNLNGIDGTVDRALYRRDPDRMAQGREHSVFTSGDLLAAGIEAMGRETELDGLPTPYFAFREETEPAGPLAAEVVTVPFSNYITATFAYDEAAGHYLRSQYGKPHTDANDGSQIAADNLFVLHAAHHSVAGDTEGRLAIDVVGGGDGMYFAGGGAVAIRWDKERDGDFFVLTTEDGQPLEVNPGTMWFCIVKNSTEIHFGAAES